MRKTLWIGVACTAALLAGGPAPAQDRWDDVPRGELSIVDLAGVPGPAPRIAPRPRGRAFVMLNFRSQPWTAALSRGKPGRATRAMPHRAPVPW